MADIFRNASLTPSKPEAVARYIQRRWPDSGATAENITLVASYRFDDPAGEVGTEVHIAHDAGGRTLQVPLTYRGAPQPGMEGTGLDGEGGAELLTLEHSELGTRWVYDGLTDRVFVSALVEAISSGSGGARYIDADKGEEFTSGRAEVRGTGTSSAVATPESLPAPMPAETSATLHLGEATLVFNSVLDTDFPAADSGSSTDSAASTPGLLLGSWPGQDAEVLLASIAD